MGILDTNSTTCSLRAVDICADIPPTVFKVVAYSQKKLICVAHHLGNCSRDSTTVIDCKNLG